MTLPADGALGDYSLRAILEADQPTPEDGSGAGPDAEPGPEDDEYVPYEKSVQARSSSPRTADPTSASTSTLAEPPHPHRGRSAERRRSRRATSSARRWAAGPSPGAIRTRAGYGAPHAITAKFARRPLDLRRVRRHEEDERPRGRGRREEDTRSAHGGQLTLTLETRRRGRRARASTRSRATSKTSRASTSPTARRSPCIRRPGTSASAARRTSSTRRRPDDRRSSPSASTASAVPGVPVEVTLTQVQWTSVRRAEGNGFYTWDTERKEIPAGSWTVTTRGRARAAVRCRSTNGGYFMLEARGRGEDGRTAVTRTSFYVLGEGYTAWARYDHNRIELVPETADLQARRHRAHHDPVAVGTGDGARHDRARGRCAAHRQFALTSTQQSITVPITEARHPERLRLGAARQGAHRSAATATSAPRPPLATRTDTSDPGKPAFRLGYVELKVEDAPKRLDRDGERRPARSTGRPRRPRGSRGGEGRRRAAGTASEVTLWAVDYGVLSLTGLPDPRRRSAPSTSGRRCR